MLKPATVSSVTLTEPVEVHTDPATARHVFAYRGVGYIWVYDGDAREFKLVVSETGEVRGVFRLGDEFFRSGGLLIVGAGLGAGEDDVGVLVASLVGSWNRQGRLPSALV